MTTIRTSGRKGREQMQQALERAKLNAKRIVEAEKNAKAQLETSREVSEDAATSLRQKAA